MSNKAFTIRDFIFEFMYDFPVDDIIIQEEPDLSDDGLLYHGHVGDLKNIDILNKRVDSVTSINYDGVPCILFYVS